MNNHSKTKFVVQVTEPLRETENPMQERHCGEVEESVQVTAETVFTARRLETQKEAGPVLVP